MNTDSKAMMIGAMIGAAAMIAMAVPLAMIAAKLHAEQPQQKSEVRKHLCPTTIKAKVLRDGLYRETEADAELVCFYENLPPSTK